MEHKSLVHTAAIRRLAAWFVALALSGACRHAPPPRVEELGSDGLRVADGAIAEAVRRELASEPAVPVEQLEITVEDGVVSLTGTVPDLLAQERAVRQAEAVRSVRAVIDRIRVTAVRRPDEQVATDVRAAIAEDPALAALSIEVSVEQAEATLAGHVGSQNQRRLAELIARGVVGLRRVQNDLTIPPTGERSDRQVAADIDARLRWDALVNGELVKAVVNEGVVTLRGTVGSAAEKARVVSDVWVPCVKRVDDHQVDVAWWARDVGDRGLLGEPDDAAIADAVRAAFRHDPRIHPPFRGSIQVFEGVVILEGEVRSLREKRAASADALHTVGVRDVTNTLVVRATNENSDATAQRLVRALARHPRLQDASIQATVRDGVAKLEGTVPILAQRIVAQEVAERTLGVVSVANGLLPCEPGRIAHYDPYSFTAAPYDGAGWHSLAGNRGVALSDAALRQRILGELRWNPLVDASRIDVTVKGAVAVLTGSVQSRAAQRAAVSEAYQAGAMGVDDRLHLGH